MANWQSIADSRREYGTFAFDRQAACDNPVTQFKLWFNEILATQMPDPTAMVLATVDEQGYPDSRVVLLKDIIDEQFVFYTNYNSRKALQLKKNPQAALNFYWPQMARQVRIRGLVEKTTANQSDVYFSSRPIMSQLSAIISPQSAPISDRHQLEEKLEHLACVSQNQSIVRPSNWGGYVVIAEEIEFWQGRDNRLHDRLQYVRKNNLWVYQRLAP